MLSGRLTAGCGFSFAHMRDSWFWCSWSAFFRQDSDWFSLFYISKLLIDDALMRRNMHALVWIAGLMFVAAVLGFVLNILASYRYVKISAAMLFDMRVALFRHLQSFRPANLRDSAWAI